MKKRFFLLPLLLFLALCGLTACSSADSMVIKPTKLSKETLEVLKPLENELLILEATPDSTVKSYRLSLWRFEDGKWVENGASYGGMDLFKDRIMLRLSDTQFCLYSMDKDGYVGSTFNLSGTEFARSSAVAAQRLSAPVDIELNKEIVLWVKLGTDQTSIRSDITEDFRTADCNAGLAVTVTFSDKEAD